MNYECIVKKIMQTFDHMTFFKLSVEIHEADAAICNGSVFSLTAASAQQMTHLLYPENTCSLSSAGVLQQKELFKFYSLSHHCEGPFQCVIVVNTMSGHSSVSCASCTGTSLNKKIQ